MSEAETDQSQESRVKSQHTPGPWETHWTHDISGYPVYSIHGVSGADKGDNETIKANALLIAAAPDLLAACKAFIDRWHTAGPGGSYQLEKFDHVARLIEIAVEKAEVKP